MEVSVQTRAPAALPLERTAVFLEQEAGRVPEPVWAVWRRDKYFNPTENRRCSSVCHLLM
jgi:hypothetical protein